MKLGIKGKITSWILVILLVPMIISTVISVKSTTDVAKSVMTESTFSLNESVSSTLTQYFRVYENGLTQTSRSGNVMTSNTRSQEDQWLIGVLRSFTDTYDASTQIYIGLPDGRFFIYPYADLGSNYDPRTRPWYTGAQENNGFYWSDIYKDAVSGDQVISGSTPIYNNGEFIGVIGTTLNMNTASEMVSKIKVGQDGYVYIFDEDMSILFHPNTSIISTKVQVKEILDEVSKSDLFAIEYPFENINGEMENKTAFVTKNNELGWYIGATLPSSELTDKSTQTARELVILVVIALIIASIVAVLVATSLTKPIKALVEDITRVSNGDLTVKSNIKSSDEIGELSKNFNTMIENIALLIANARDVAFNVSQTSENLAASSQEVSASAEEVNRAVSEIAQGATEQASDAQNSVMLANDLDAKFSALEESNSLINQGTHEVIENNKAGEMMIDKLQDSSAANNESSRKIDISISELEKKSQEIGLITDTISSIADQTNLLALNASIEAARAGEHGRGFAVVAEEIRKLAEDSSNSAESIKSIITLIQNLSQSSVEAMEEFKSNSAVQNESVDEVQLAFKNISDSIYKISENIATSSGDIKNMIESKNKIITSISNISSVSEETAASSEEVSATIDQLSNTIDTVANSAGDLNELSINLTSEINKFKV